MNNVARRRYLAIVAFLATAVASSCGSTTAVGQTPGAGTTMGTETTPSTTASAGTAIGPDVSVQSSTTVGAVSQTAPASSSSTPATNSSPSTAPPSPPPGTGVYGYVTAGPTCPVERPDQPCPPRPVTAEVDALDASSALVAKGQSDAAGRYSLSLAAGSYTLTVSSGMTFPRCPAIAVTVHAGTPTRADISCDTGIR